VVHHFNSIIDVLSARSSSEALAYVFLADGTSDGEIRWTFSDLATKSGAFAALLSDRMIATGDRVVLAVNPSLEYIAALYGIMQVGAVPVPCFPPLRLKEIDRFHAITEDCSPRAIVIDAMYGEQMANLRERIRSDAFEPDVIHPEQVATSATHLGTRATRAPCAPDDIALLQYTSGSTGSPKGVCITHDNLVSNCETLDRSMGYDPNRVGLCWLPPYHDMGLMGTIILAMYHGWPLVLMSPLHFVQQPRRWLQAISDYRVTTTVGPNFSLDLCVTALDEDADETDGLDLSTVKQLYCGAEPIFADTLGRFQQKLGPLGFDTKALLPCYGMAEATLFIAGKRDGSTYRTDSAAEADGSGRVVVSCGEVDSEHTVRIVDPTDFTRLDDGVVGEVWLSGRSIAAGYFNQPELSREVFQAKLSGDDRAYLRTGDLGFIRSGELFVTGRMKDLIIINGRNIYPQDVEATVIGAHPAVRIAVAFSIDIDSSEQLCVVAETRPANRYPELVDVIRSSVTAEFRVRADVHICPRRSIPTTTSGKVRRQESKRAFLAGGLRSLPTDSLARQGSMT
jgi:acyl-CoA synthetase (AMP-forming)/AMP-acid ligase II